MKGPTNNHNLWTGKKFSLAELMDENFVGYFYIWVGYLVAMEYGTRLYPYHYMMGDAFLDSYNLDNY